jgi:hypothetical protein
LEKKSDIQQIIESAIQRILGSDDTPGNSRSLEFPQVSSKRKGGSTYFEDLETFGTALSGKYDELTAKGLLIRIGRETFNIVRQSEPDISALGSIKNRLKPINKRFNDSLKITVDWFSVNFGFAVKNKEDAVFTYCLEFERKDNPIFYSPFFLFGFFEEFCHWLDARKNYRLVYNKPEESKTGEIRIEISHPD